MKMEQLRLGWYLKNISAKMLLGWIVGMATLMIEVYIYY
jgi:hypothetical protein